jgi:hypothetical protein
VSEVGFDLIVRLMLLCIVELEPTYMVDNTGELQLLVAIINAGSQDRSQSRKDGDHSR